MAKKEFNQIPDKTSLDDSDRFLLSTANGARRVTKTNLISAIKGDSILNEVYISPKAGDWIRVARLYKTSWAKMGIFVFLPAYINVNPVPFIMTISWASILAGSFHYVWPQQRFDGTYMAPIFDKMRIVDGNDGWEYLEFHVYSNVGWTTMRYGFIWKTDQIERLSATITTANTENIAYTCDLTTQTTNINTMQQADLQAKMGG